MSTAPSFHLAFVDRRLPTWLKAASPAQRRLLERRIRDSHSAMRRLQAALAGVQAPEQFCRTRLEQSLAHAFPQRELPTVDDGWLRREGQAGGMSWLEAAMQNFDAGDPVKLYMHKRDATRMTLDSEHFVKAVRNLDLGGLYQAHLGDHLGNDSFLEQLRLHDRAAFAAELYLARLQGHLDDKGMALGDAALAASPAGDGNHPPLQCSYLSLFGLPLAGPLLVRRRPGDAVEACLLYLPGHPTHAMRQYPSLNALGQSLTQMLWQDGERRFFLRYVAHAEQTRFALKLRETLYPSYPYERLLADTPVLEKGQRFSWISRVFPSPRAIWQDTLDQNARLPLDHTPWARDCFAERARSQRERHWQDAASIVVPVAQRDAAAQLARIEGWLQAGLNVLNVASFFVPGLAEVMLAVGGAQLVDEFLEGVHAANQADADAAIGHLFAVFEGLAQFAALGAAGHFIEPQGTLHGWQRIGTGEQERLWHGNLTPFAQPRPWPEGMPLPTTGVREWQGQSWLELDGQALPVEVAGKGRWRLAAARGQRHQPHALGNGEGAWVLDHERPLAWSSQSLMRRLRPAGTGLDDATLAKALHCSGYDEATLREVLVDHRPLPALLQDSLEAFGATPTTLAQAADSQVLARDFPGLSPRVRNEILAQATPHQRAELQRSGRLPLAMAESARLYLRQTRINRALAHLCRTPGADPDRDTLVFANLARLPGWTGDIRLELSERGRTSQAVGRPEATLKRVTRLGSQYEPSDARGQVLANRGDLFHAILRALPDSERQALGLHIGDRDGLREALYALAANDREGTARHLGMAAVRPLYRLPSRLPGSHRLGYALSGRGHGWQAESELFDQLYPAAPGAERQVLRQRLRHQAGPQPGALNRLLEGLRDDYQQLDHDLQAWVEQGAGEQRTLRDNQAQSIRQAWRRQNPEGTIDDIDYIVLDIDALQLPDLPVLRGQLEHVRQLRVSGLIDHADTRLDGFLRAFPRLRQLDLEDNALRSLPPALAELGELQILDLGHNNLDFSQGAAVQPLLGLRNLQQLNLSHSLDDLPVAALEQLSALPSLQFLQLADNGLALGAQHFEALQRWPGLTHLELGRNAITLNEQSRSALAALNRLQLLSLRHNPLQLAPDLRGWARLEQLDLENSGLSHWPIGLAELMHQEPLNLVAIDLSLNTLSDAPDLRASTFARRIREGDIDLHYAFEDNSFSEAALRSLDEAGLPVGNDLAEHDWSEGWPPALRVHLAEFWQTPDWQPLHDLYQRLPSTEAYELSPLAMNERMRHTLQTLVDGSQDPSGWGFSELQQRINDRLVDAGQECVDQASLLFQQVETEVSLWRTAAHAAPGADHEQVAVDSAASLLRQQLLDQRIGELFNARRARRTALAEANDDAARQRAPALARHDALSDQQLSDPQLPLDELEMALYARMRLQDRLRLPAQPEGMRFEYLARLQDSTLQSLAQAVWNEASALRLQQWVVDQPFWPRWLQRLRPAPFEALQVEWEAASEYFDTLNEPVTIAGPYIGPTVPQAYVDSLEAAMGQVAWRRAGVLQRVDLSADSGLYAQASALLLQGRQQAHEQFLVRLTTLLSQANPQAFLPTAN